MSENLMAHLQPLSKCTNCHTFWLLVFGTPVQSSAMSTFSLQAQIQIFQLKDSGCELEMLDIKLNPIQIAHPLCENVTL